MDSLLFNSTSTFLPPHSILGKDPFFNFSSNSGFTLPPPPPGGPGFFSSTCWDFNLNFVLTSEAVKDTASTISSILNNFFDNLSSFATTSSNYLTSKSFNPQFPPEPILCYGIFSSKLQNPLMDSFLEFNKAIDKKNKSMLQKLHDKGKLQKIKFLHGYHLAFIAAKKNSALALRFLEENGYSVNEPLIVDSNEDSSGKIDPGGVEVAHSGLRPIDIAAAHGSQEALSFFKEKGFFEVVDEEKIPSIIYALQSDRPVETLTWFLDNKISFHTPPSVTSLLVEAAANKQISVIRYIFQNRDLLGFDFDEILASENPCVNPFLLEKERLSDGVFDLLVDYKDTLSRAVK